MHLTSVIFFVCYFLFIIAFFQPVSCICLSFMLFYFLSFTSNNWERKKCYGRKKNIYRNTYILCAQRWNQMTGSKTRISSRHILSTVGTCMFRSWFFLGLVLDCSKQQATAAAAAATNRTELNCGLLLFISSLFFCWRFVNHRLKTKYDRKCDLNEDNESVKWQISIRKRINECDNTKKTKKVSINWLRFSKDSPQTQYYFTST